MPSSAHPKLNPQVSGRWQIRSQGREQLARLGLNVYAGPENIQICMLILNKNQIIYFSLKNCSCSLFYSN